MKTIPELAKQAGICYDLLDQTYPHEYKSVSLDGNPDDTQVRLAASIGEPGSDSWFFLRGEDGEVLARNIIIKAGDRSRDGLIRQRLEALAKEKAELEAKLQEGQ